MAKKSRQVENRIQSSKHVLTAAKTHRQQVAESLAARAIDVQGANTQATKDSFLVVIDFLADALGQSAQSLDEAELRLVAERADDFGLRDERDAATSGVYQASVRVRSMVADALGSRALEVYGLAGETPRLAKDVASHARTVAKLLQEKPFQVTVEGVTFDSAALAATLESKALALDTALANTQREEQELADQLGKRDAQVAKWTDDYQGIADALVGLFRLAGRKDLSERVRPSSRTLAGEDVVPEQAPEAPASPQP